MEEEGSDMMGSPGSGMEMDYGQEGMMEGDMMDEHQMMDEMDYGQEGEEDEEMMDGEEVSKH
jgi:hypothetical protein